MNTFLLLIYIFLLISIIHLAFFSNRLSIQFSKFLFDSIDYDNFKDYYSYKTKVNQTIFFSIVSFLFPLVSYKLLITYNSGNDTIDLIFLSCIILIALFGLWLDIKQIDCIQLNKEIEICTTPTLLDYDTSSSLPQIKVNVETSLNSYDVSHDIKLFQEFLQSHSEFEDFDIKKKQFELSSYSINGKTILKHTHACLILIVFFYEEILYSKSYLDELSPNYYTPLNTYFNLSLEIDKTNWSSFKKKYIKDLGVISLKQSEFYSKLLIFHKK